MSTEHLKGEEDAPDCTCNQGNKADNHLDQCDLAIWRKDQ